MADTTAVKDGYFVLGCTPDGTTFDGPMSAEELERRLATNQYGEVRFANRNPGTDGFCIQLEDDELLIICGRIVQPKQITTVTKWKLP